MRQETVDPAIFTENRKRFIRKMKPGSIAIFNSNDELPMNGDALHPFRQNSDLYWLTGIIQEDTMLVLFPDSGAEKLYSEFAACHKCSVSVPPLSTQLFSFNNPQGACSECGGLGVKQFFDPALPVSEEAFAVFQTKGWHP